MSVDRNRDAAIPESSFLQKHGGVNFRGLQGTACGPEYLIETRGLKIADSDAGQCLEAVQIGQPDVAAVYSKDAVLLQAAEKPAHRFHRQAQIIADVIA